MIRASFGSTKYCSHFLRNIECINKNCLYYHYIVNDKEIVLKDENSMSTSTLHLAIKLADIYNAEIKAKLTDKKNQIKNNVLPLTGSIYLKDFVIENDVKHAVKCISNNSLKSLLNSKKQCSNDDDSKKLIFNQKKENYDEECNHNMAANVESEISTISTRNSFNMNNNCDEPEIRLNNDLNQTLRKKSVKSSLYKKREKSRFQFVQNEKDLENNVPDFINDIIYKKLSTQYILKNINIDGFNDFEPKNLDQDWLDFITIFNKKSQLSNDF